MSKYGMKRERLLIELEMDSKYVVKVWAKLDDFLRKLRKDEKVRSIVKVEQI